MADAPKHGRDAPADIVKKAQDVFPMIKRAGAGIVLTITFVGLAFRYWT